MVGCGCGWKSRNYGGGVGVGHAGDRRLRVRRMDRAVNGVRLADGVGSHGRRMLELLLWNSLGRVERRRRLLVRHISSLIHGVILSVLLRHPVRLSIGVVRIRVLRHV